MKLRRTAVTFFPVLLLIIVQINPLFAGSAGSRASFTRGGWAGAEYVAMGNSSEAIVDDLFALYWNPAGLSAMASRNTTSPDEIRKKAEGGDVSGVTEEDLLRFSETRDTFFFQIGVSASTLDIEREAAFSGCAMKLFGGVFGAGAYSIYSDKIDMYDENAAYTGQTSYVGSVGYIAYSRAIGPASVGVTLKPVYEKIDDASYSGGACDAGVQAEILPFIKAGCVVQDIGIGLYPVSGSGLEKKYDFGAPVIRGSVAFDSRASDLSVSAGVVYKLEQEK
ncbi:MAG: hypothetical protein ACRCUT_14380, partial [Spirochaetota bacterium]